MRSHCCSLFLMWQLWNFKVYIFKYYISLSHSLIKQNVEITDQSENYFTFKQAFLRSVF